MNRPPEGPAHVSLFPMPPWDLINKYSDFAISEGTSPSSPTIPTSTSYSMFGNRFNTDDPILRPLESFGVRRVYPHTYNRKPELKKINFSILTNYLDLLDLITRDPSSPKRKEKLEHIEVLFINMHHILNEYRPHQARDLLREMLTYQVKVASETVRLGEQYLKRANETLSQASQQLITTSNRLSASSSDMSPTFTDLGPELASFLTELQSNTRKKIPLPEIKQRRIGKRDDEVVLEDLSEAENDSEIAVQPTSLNAALMDINSKSEINSELEPDLDPCIWLFLQDECSMEGF